jgi:hypothetical protein
MLMLSLEWVIVAFSIPCAQASRATIKSNPIKPITGKIVFITASIGDNGSASAPWKW